MRLKFSRLEIEDQPQPNGIRTAAIRKFSRLEIEDQPQQMREEAPCELSLAA